MGNTIAYGGIRFAEYSRVLLTGETLGTIGPGFSEGSFWVYDRGVGENVKDAREHCFLQKILAMLP